MKPYLLPSRRIQTTACALLSLLAAAFTTASASASDSAPTQQDRFVRLQFQTAGSESDPRDLLLTGSDARQQLLVTGELDTSGLRDLTHRVTYSSEPAGVVNVSPSGRVMPEANGSATIIAHGPDNLSASLPVTVRNYEIVTPINFPNKIVPIFTKAGCNSGGCHGKSGGQNGFRLSLLGFEPEEDWEHLVKEARGRRLFPGAPERSLLLLKSIASLPHGGGKRLEEESDDYHLLQRWVAQGMPYGEAGAPTVERIEVFPKSRTLPFNGEQQLVVTAHYTDGTTEDVTGSALYESNDKEMAESSSSGHITAFEQPGSVAIMVRYQARVAVFQAIVPLGAPVNDLPSPRNFIDELVFQHLQVVGMPPSPMSDDSTFLRRLTLDIAGRLPTPGETQSFLADTSEHKRDQAIDTLLNSTGYAEHFANKWSALLRNKRSRDTFKRGNFAFHNWIRDSLHANKPYNEFVREVVAAAGDTTHNPPAAWYREVTTPTAQLEDSAQLFLGMRLQCAQCHHHPFERWSQEDYYSFSAFFSQVGRKAGEMPGEEVIFHKRGKPTATNKKTNQPVLPAGLGAEPLELDPGQDPRHALADWMSQSDNPFFAHAFVNRYWKHFFGRGLVDPEDDMRETNPASNPDLLDALARHFIDQDYDMKDLVRTICQSRVYQLSPLPNDHNAVDKKNFSRYYPKRLSAEVLLDAVDRVLKSETKFDGLPAGTRAVQLPDNSFNSQSYFLTVFGRPDNASSCECERSQDASLAQCLHLLNAKEIQDKLSSNDGRAASLAQDETRSDDEKVRELYLLAFSREPNPEELQLARDYITLKVSRANPGTEPAAETPAAAAGDEKAGKDKEEKPDPARLKRDAYEDMVWALINTKEFLFNH